jgi:hypothetical protein
MTPELAEALLDVATTPDVTPWRASEALRAAGAGPRDRVRECTDKRLWAVVGGHLGDPGGLGDGARVRVVTTAVATLVQV